MTDTNTTLYFIDARNPSQEEFQIADDKLYTIGYIYTAEHSGDSKQEYMIVTVAGNIHAVEPTLTKAKDRALADLHILKEKADELQRQELNSSRLTESIDQAKQQDAPEMVR